MYDPIEFLKNPTDQILEPSNIFAWCTNNEGAIRYVSKDFLKFTGRSEAEILADGWEKILHADDVSGIKEMLCAGITGTQSFAKHARVRNSIGKFVRLFVVGSPKLDEVGQVDGMQGHFILGYNAEQPPAKTELNDPHCDQMDFFGGRFSDWNALRRVHVGFWHSTAEDPGYILTQHFERLLHLAEGQLGDSLASFQQLIHPDDFDRVVSHHDRLFGFGQECEVDFRLRNRDGEFLWFRSIGHPLLDSAGRVYEVLGTIIDIHDLKRTQLVADDERRVRDEFLSMISHELRNPLAAIIHAVRFIMELDNVPDEQLQMFDIIKRQSGQMADLMDDLLDVTRLTRKNIQFEKTSLDIFELLGQTIESMRSRFQEKQQDLVVQIPDCASQVLADASRLQQVFANLLDNSSKYSPKGSKIYITAEVVETDAVIRIRDEGQGIAKELQPHIFDLFFQEAPSLSRSSKGLGVGLFLVKKIIAGHNGDISVESGGKGDGACFTLRLPTTEKTSKVITNQSEIRFENVQLALVEDHDDSRRLLASVLGGRGFDVYAFENAESLLPKLDEQTFQVAIIDIGLPGASGYVLAQSILESQTAFKPVLIALSGYGLKSDRKKCLDSGFDLHLTKPVKINVLCEAVAKLLALKDN